ncbi:MAG: ABC transporter substrate-binding protein [Acidobacteriota bacterium]
MLIRALKRLALGTILIAGASAILLFADRGHRTTVARAIQRVAIFQHANTPVLDDGVRGVVDGLAERGYRDGDQITIATFNAQGDMPTGTAIARQLIGGDYDLVITSSTPSMQAVASNNRDGKVRHVFTLVADPFQSGVGLDRADPLKHPPYMAGQGSFPPVDTAFTLARQMLPGLQRIGVPWNPAETNSRVFVERGRTSAADMGLTLLEATADTTSGVGDAVNALIARDAQALWIGGDNTVSAAINTVIGIARRAGVPVFTILPGAPDRGSLFDTGPNFYEVGRQGGFVAADVLGGADMAAIPVRDVLDIVPPFLSINTTVLKGLKEAWRVPPDLLAQADIVVDEAGVHRKTAPTGAPPRGEATQRPLTKTWRISLIELNRILDVEEAEKGVLDGLRDEGLVEGRDFRYTIRNAQGDMPTVSALVDAAVADADLLITFSTPTLQAALQRATRLPVIFNYVADPFAAGAGTSDQVHAPNVTGVYLIGAYAEMLPMIRAYLPMARVIGTVYVPAEVNMVSQRAVLEAAARAAGMELKAVAANSSSEVADATLALIAGGVDAICQLPGNLTAAAFPSIAEAARRARVPIFAFQSSQARSAVLTLARDYYDSGREAAKQAARVMRGERPSAIPFQGFSKTTTIVNPAAAQALGLTPPAAIRAKATVMGQ